MQYEEDIRKIINTILNIRGYEIDINEDLQVLGMDSLAFIRIIIAVEDAFRVEFSENNLFPTEMNTIKKICEELETMLRI